MTKKCGICNSENDSNSVYCKKCGKFLYVDSKSHDNVRYVKSIWEIDGNEIKNETKPKVVTEQAKSSSEKIVICPICKLREPIVKGVPPLFCSACNYIFQDSDVYDADTNNYQLSLKKADEHREIFQVSQKTTTGPMRKFKMDQSYLCLIGERENKYFIIEVNTIDGMIGSKGTIGENVFSNKDFRKIQPKQLRVTHTPVGWYVQVLAGNNRINNDALRAGTTRQLSDGDFLQIEKVVFRVEILENKMQTCRLSHSLLRLIGMGPNDSFIIENSPVGNIQNSDVLKNHVQIWCSMDKWYIRALSQLILVNGTELNIGINKEIHNGELINIGQKNIRIEITEK